MKQITSVNFWVIVGTFSLTGCAIGPAPTKPSIGVADQWKEGRETTDPTLASDGAASFPPTWWSMFNDSQLDAIQVAVNSANQDIQRAHARLAEARALARLHEADLYPQLALSESHTRFRTSGSESGMRGEPRQHNEHSVGVGLAYDLDFSGRSRRSQEASRAHAGAAADDLHAVILAATAQAARHLFQIRSLDEERSVIESALALRRDAVRLQETRNRAGLINEVEVARSRTELATVESELHAVERRRARLEHTLAVLCGQTTRNFASASASQPTLP